MDTNKYIGVILAGGKGSRIHPLSERFSKCTLPLCNIPLMEYHIKMMKDAGITDIAILVGHNGFDVVSAIGNGQRQGVNIKYINQEERLGIAHAVGKLEPYIDRPFLLFLGDIYFDCPSIKPLIDIFETDKVNAVLATKIESDREAIKRNFAVILDQNEFVSRVIEKPRYIHNDIKGCGLYLFDLHIFDAIRRTPRTAMRDEYEITDSIQIMIQDGFKVKTSNIINNDLNITFIEDLLMLNLTLLNKSGKNTIIGKNTSIKNESHMDNVVVGDNVVIKNDIKIKNSLIFSNTVVSTAEDINNSIVLNDQIINCNNINRLSWRG